MLKRYFPLMMALLTVLLVQGVVVVRGHGEGVSDERFARLSKGVNIARWFLFNQNQSAEYYRNYVSDDQLQELRDAGFTHVRLVIDPWYMWNADDFSALPEETIAPLDEAIERLVAHDLAVVVEMHAQEDFKTHLMTEADFQQGFADMWHALAAHLSTTDPEMVFLEVMNEPSPPHLEDWLPIQEQAVAAMREGAPEHTIIVGGPDWNGINGLVMLKAFDDPNIVYNFHFYEPFWFTHQRATWTNSVAADLHGLRYPSTDGRCGELPDFGNDAANKEADWYCNHDTWDATHIATRIQQAVDWAAENHVRLTCNEFGVYPVASVPVDRYQWYTDVRTVLEANDIGWSVWAYDDSFGFDYERMGKRLDAKLLAALGMTEK